MATAQPFRREDRTAIPHSAPSTNQSRLAHSQQRFQAVSLPGNAGAVHSSDIATWLGRHIYPETSDKCRCENKESIAG